MIDKKLCEWVKFIIVLMGICGLLFDVFLVPIEVGNLGTEGGQYFDKTNISFIVQYFFQWIVSIPCFWVLILAWRACGDMKTGNLFTVKNSKRVKQASVALLISVVAFIVGNLIFAILKWNSEYSIRIIIAIMGVTFWVIMTVLSHYLKRAAELQEESDATI